MTCTRVIIINKGRIEACDNAGKFARSHSTAGGVTLEAKVGADDAVAELRKNHGRPRCERGGG